MSNVLPFVSRERLTAEAALQDFIAWAKSQIHHYDKPEDPVQWSAVSWHRWGLKQAVFTKLGGEVLLNNSFIDFAKAFIFEERAIKLSEDHIGLQALRCLEAALIDTYENAEVININSAILDKACQISQDYHDYDFTSYRLSRKLKKISDFINLSGFVSSPFVWDPQLKISRVTLSDSEMNSNKKLPSDESLVALCEIFNSKPQLPLDIMVSSAAIIMLSQPCRVGELQYLKKDCFYTEFNDEGLEQLYIFWYSEKGFGQSRKPIIDSMSTFCREAVDRIKNITDEPRKYAQWLEENPESFPLHEMTPDKESDEPLTYQEACDALMLSTKNHSPRFALKRFMVQVFNRKTISEKARNIAKDFLDNLQRFDASDMSCASEAAAGPGVKAQDISLSKLNILVREKYLPSSFPYTDERRITKWKDALFCFRTGTFKLAEYEVRKPFGLTGCDPGRLSAQLSSNQKKTKSIFERYGYVGVKVKTHAFRHYLNTAAQRGNMGQELISRLSGRLDIKQNAVYNHMTVEEKADEVDDFLPRVPVLENDLLSSLKTNVPIRMMDIGEEGDRIVHRTEFGICIHDYAQEPCAKFNNCLTCGEHICVKGDETKLENLKEEREYLRSSLESFHKQANEGTYGANTWLKTSMEKMERCDQLIQMLESSDVENGAIIRGVENGWTLGRNALAVRGELFEENSGLIETDIQENKVAELERLLGFGG